MSRHPYVCRHDRCGILLAFSQLRSSAKTRHELAKKEMGAYMIISSEFLVNHIIEIYWIMVMNDDLWKFIVNYGDL